MLYFVYMKSKCSPPNLQMFVNFKKQIQKAFTLLNQPLCLKTSAVPLTTHRIKDASEAHILVQVTMIANHSSQDLEVGSCRGD